MTMMTDSRQRRMVQALVVGAGPAGLMAAEQLALTGLKVEVFDAMPSVARKFLRAGVGGLNLTHAEDYALFCSRYSASDTVGAWLQDFKPQDLRDWAAGLGIETFTGSSGRVFPQQLKASPLLRAWLQRLHDAGVSLSTGHRWLGWEDDVASTGKLHRFVRRDGNCLEVLAQVTVLALGGSSWSRLGSDGRWAEQVQGAGIACAPFRAANCGFSYPWSKHISERYAGAPLKSVALALQEPHPDFPRKGEAMLSRHGIEGSLVYHASRPIREQIEKSGEALIYWDLLPDSSLQQVEAALARPQGKESFSNWMRKRLGISGAKMALLRELAPRAVADRTDLAGTIKRLPMHLSCSRPLDEAISSAGGICLKELDEHLMLKKAPGLFCAGEMLDWEAPTGGYLLNACLASGKRAGLAAAGWLSGQ